ncbi:MAG TPA: hypothetical protein VGB66_17640 [Longimicrobium sp.]
MRAPILSLFLVLAAAACTDEAPTAVPREPEGGGPIPLGVYEFTVTGISGGEPSANAAMLDMAMPGAGGASASLSATDGFNIEEVSVNSISEGGRSRGYRYVAVNMRVRNTSGAPMNNVTFIPVLGGNAIAGTPFVKMLKFDGTQADTLVALRTVPSGLVTITDNGEMRSPQQDVLQVFEEAEVAAIPLPVGVTGIFPYGFVLRSKLSTSNRLIPANTNPNQFDGLLTFSFRIPLQRHDPGTTNGATKDAFSFTFRMMAVQDTEVRLTESIEEGQDSSAVRRLRDRAAAMGATTVTVLNGSPAADPSVADYPGQRQICSVRTAGIAGSPRGTINARAEFVRLAVLRPGEAIDSCAPYFRSGTPGRPATNVPFALTVAAVDRYGNLIGVTGDSVQLSSVSGPPGDMGPETRMAGGLATINVTYTDYGTSVLRATARRSEGIQSLVVAGVTRTWTGAGGTTDWHTGANWAGGAVPMSQDSVLIPEAASLDPVLAANVSIQGVTVEAGAVISLNAFDLTAGGDVSASNNSGQGITNTTGRLVLAGTAKTVTGRLPRLRVTGTYSLVGNVSARAPLEVSAGRLTNATYRVQLESF